MNITNRVQHTGHESVLNTFLKKGKIVTVQTLSGKSFYGKIRAFDRFTISIDIDIGGKTQPMVFFKHALESFHSDDLS